MRLEAFERAEMLGSLEEWRFLAFVILAGTGKIQRIGPCVVMLGRNPRTTLQSDAPWTARVMKSFGAQLAYSEGQTPTPPSTGG